MNVGNKVDYAIKLLELYGRTIIADDGNAEVVIEEIRKKVNISVSYNGDDLGKFPFVGVSHKIYKHYILTRL